MKAFSVNKKTGFTINDPSKPLIIRDNRGLLFYSTEFMLPKKLVTCFNMPGFGKFFIETGNISVRPAPIEYPKVIKPGTLKPRVNPLTGEPFPSPLDFDVEWGINPNKCTIKWNEHIIFFDSMFKEKPLPVVFFILGHEYAHEYSEDESICDQISGDFMKDLGFNPSQIAQAPQILSDRANQRKINMVNSLIQANG